MKKILSNIKYLLFFLLFSTLITLGYFQVENFENKITDLNNSLDLQKNEIVDIQNSLELLQKVNSEDLAKLEKNILDEKSKREILDKEYLKQKEDSNFQISKLEEKILANEKNLVEVVSQWDSYVVSVECNFNSSETGKLVFQTNGSGLLTQWENTSIGVLTNKHVISAISLGSDELADNCKIKFPQENIVLNSNNFSILTVDLDWGIIYLNFQNNLVDELMKNPPYLCNTDPDLGDLVLILGYPSIGDENNVTVTEGIISGFDENYFITSAKVEQGNSGGAAISLKDNCYLGTPTFSTKGNLESLARILDVKVLVE
mgnify:CR=1 FL=1